MFDATLKDMGWAVQVIFTCGCTVLYAEGSGTQYSVDDDAIDVFACEGHQFELDGMYPDYKEDYPMYDMDGSLFHPGCEDGEE